MTGGVIVVLGTTGRNIGAGMTGGVAFLLDEANNVECLVNKEIVEIFQVSTSQQEGILKPLIEKYLKSTNSFKAKEILSNWNVWKNKFKILVPPSEKQALGLENLEKILA